ncbi:hypothetical protein EJ08DRAFT_667416 [Tothia fuscella]|uniref:C3H1-type domain-containing protein n=1 Tax=Tothia fuscella TaxID=1048955 RepID=A0A9P4U4I2_9PEZI|nr:hypothetical protein EJ08DRAFT_667416 [Tothia fuscella]
MNNGQQQDHNMRGPVQVPRGPMGNGQQQQQQQQGFNGARSPPNGKNTSHVPCKFFRQGTCQAGKACPFLHSAESMAPCKYFQKGNCKFGMKCANEHITADGRRINKPGNHAIQQAHFNLGGRVMPSQGPQPGSSLLSMQQDHLSQPQPIPGPGPIDYMNSDMWRNPPYDIPTIDTTFSSHPGSNYGSPPNDGRFPMSPTQKGLEIRDAPLPASFDSQGISVFARTGPMAASVPSRFGLDSSPSSSLPNRTFESSALRNLHTSAFGDDIRNSSLASSPPVEEPIGRRIMHSERFSRQPKMISASVGAQPPLALTDEWDENFAFEEDLVPTSLHDLLTPQERMRRSSRSNAEEETHFNHRQALSGLGSPADSNSKVGSPSTASPSRFNAFFGARAQQEEASKALNLPGASAFGHVGSTLRNSSLHVGASPSLRANSRPVSGDVSPFVSSPPRQSTMGMISQQLQRTRLSSRPSDENPGTPASLQHPGVARVTSGSSITSNGPGRLDRAVSSNSVGRDKIDEEPELFSMDDEETSKRSSGAWAHGSPFSIGKASPRLGPIGGQRSSGIAGKENGWANGT